MSTKENLINSITLSLITKNDYTVPEIKRVLEEELSKYAIFIYKNSDDPDQPYA